MKYSNNFNESFNFYLLSGRYKVLDFCGESINISYNKKAKKAKEAFKDFENGVKIIESSQPNVLRTVITAKKAWGLWCKEWSDGVVEGSFNREEILDNFSSITVPEKYKVELDNLIMKKLKSKHKQ